MNSPELRFHGDRELAPGLIDLAVNVRLAEPPAWLAAQLSASLRRISAYPDLGPARAAVAARHGRSEDEVLLTAGAAEAFTLIARALRPRHSVVVHPQFTEPEVALRAAGHLVERVVLSTRDGFRLDPRAIPSRADLVVIGNPTNPTSVLHPAADLAVLARPGRVLVVDEAFADTVPGEPGSLAGDADLPGAIVVRSMTKMWGLAGLRVGYLLAAPRMVTLLATAQPPWAVSTPALAALQACSTDVALEEAARAAEQIQADRRFLLERLAALRGIRMAGRPASSFVLIWVPGGDRVRQALREKGYAVRRADTFPGLGPGWLRIAVRDRDTSEGFVDSLAGVL